MFALSISLSEETLTALKLDLNRRLPAVKSSHRCEGLARALGFEKYASLLSAVANGKTAPLRQINGARFTSYLEAHGFMVAEASLWKGIARVELERIRQAEPRLTVWGLGHGQWHRRADGTEETVAERRTRFAADRTALSSEGALLPFLTAMAMLAQVPKTKTIRPKAWSYWLKHIAENMRTTFPDGSGLGPIYVPNGILIAAALASGFEVYHHSGQDGLDVNASFNMPYATLVELDIAARPNGARAQARRRKQEERELATHVR